MIVVGVYGIVGFAADLRMHVLVHPFPSPLPRESGWPLCAGSGRAEGVEGLGGL